MSIYEHLKSPKAQTVPLWAGVAALMVVFVALFADVGHLWVVRTEQSTAADAASLAGASMSDDVHQVQYTYQTTCVNGTNCVTTEVGQHDLGIAEVVVCPDQAKQEAQRLFDANKPGGKTGTGFAQETGGQQGGTGNGIQFTLQKSSDKRPFYDQVKVTITDHIGGFISWIAGGNAKDASKQSVDASNTAIAKAEIPNLNGQEPKLKLETTACTDQGVPVILSGY